MKPLKLIWMASVVILMQNIFIQAAEKETKISWNLNSRGEKITATPKKFSLESNVKSTASCITGNANRYMPELDMRDKGWTLSGIFSHDANDKVMEIAGTRVPMSGYTGWDLIMYKGRLRVLAGADSGKRVQVFSKERYDDGKEHKFRLSWQPDGAKGKIELTIDDSKHYRLAGAGDLGANTSRRFAIGCQPNTKGSNLPLWGGTLKDFTMTINQENSIANSADAAKLDPEMASPKTSSDTNDITWINIGKDRPELIQGKGWEIKEAPFRRLPKKFEHVVRPEVWSLSSHSAGVCLHFKVRGTSHLSFRWKIARNAYFPHITPLAANGLDLYVKLDGKWRWARSTRPTPSELEQSAEKIINFNPSLQREFIVYLPFLTCVRELYLGVSPGSKVEEVKVDAKPLVFYGTSITHGCGVSRAGMTYPAQLGRRLARPVINLGFSGNGTMDFEFAAILAKIDAGAYIIDCVPNMTSMPAKEITDRTHKLVSALRKARPNTPIILMEDRAYAYANVGGGRQTFPRWKALEKAFAKLNEDGLQKLFYVKGADLLGDDGDATVDGSHPTDLGAYRYCDAVEPVLRKALDK